VKGLYSLHRKVIRQQRGLEQVYDLLAVRVITDNERNCYAASVWSITSGARSLAA
jgi:GTP pyrophosphokinase